MASKENAIAVVDAHQLAAVIRNGTGSRFDKVEPLRVHCFKAR